MARKEFDPLAYIPAPQAIRRKLAETERLSRQLKILLGISEAIDVESAGASDVRTCGNCRWWARAKDSRGECRRFPPQMYYCEYGPDCLFPRTGDMCWCGEWAPKQLESEPA